MIDVNNGNTAISPEFSSAQGAKVAGRIDFVIPSVQWGIEVIRDGNRLNEHNNRFRDGGAYHAWLQAGKMTDYILLDFRHGRLILVHCIFVDPSPSHLVFSDIQKLFHVVFDQKFQTAKIYDNTLDVSCEQFMLLEN